MKRKKKNNKTIFIICFLALLFIALTIFSYTKDISNHNKIIKANGDGKFQEITAYDNGTIVSTTYVLNKNGKYTEFQEVTTYGK